MAQGLGYWAACYQELPGAPSGRDKGYSPKEAIHQVRRSHTSDFEPGRLIFEQVMGLDDETDFADAIDLVSTAGRYLRIHLAANRDLRWTVPEERPVHHLLRPCRHRSLRHLAPYLDDEDVRLAARYAWQACAAVYAWYAIDPPPDISEVEPPEVGKDELIGRAVAAGGAHTLKFTETCLRKCEINPSPISLALAYDAAERLGSV